MTKDWAKRIRKLESQLRPRTLPRVVLRYGVVKRLPNDASGERHIVVSKSEPTALLNVEQCGFEERLGPAPASDEISFDVYLSFETESETPP